MRNKFAMALSATFVAGIAQAQSILPNNPAGDYFTNAGPSNQGQAVGTSGFFYNNTRNGGTVGINMEIPRNGQGSVYFKSQDGGDKSDFEYLASGTNVGGNFFALGSLGTLGSLESLSYSWYKKGTSTSSAFMPALRILVDADGNLATNYRGGIVFETAYNGMPSPTTDAWVTEDIFGYNSGAGANMWTFGAGMSFTQLGFGVKLSEWQQVIPIAGSTINANSICSRISMGRRLWLERNLRRCC